MKTRTQRVQPVYAPKPGVYILWLGQQCVYVGSSLNTDRRLRYHNLRGQFDRVEVIECATDDLASFEQETIDRLQPLMNQRLVVGRPKVERRLPIPLANLRTIRTLAGIGAGELAQLVGMDKGQYSRMERGLMPCTVHAAENISRFFSGSITEMELLYPERFPPTTQQ